LDGGTIRFAPSPRGPITRTSRAALVAIQFREITYSM